MKINYLSKNDIFDEHAWSGTISAMSRELKTVYDLQELRVRDPFSRKVLRKALKLLKLERVYYLFEQRLNKKSMKKFHLSEQDITFAPVCSGLVQFIGPKSGKVIYLSDSTYNLLHSYYPNYVDKSVIESEQRNNYDKLTFSRADEIIFASDWAKEDAVNTYKVNEDKVHVIPFGANIQDHFNYEYFSPQKQTFNFLLVGVDWKRKGVDIAIDAINILNQKKDGRIYHLNIVGLDKPDNLPNNQNITFFGKLNKSDVTQNNTLIDLYNKSDVFILPTKAECAGIVFCEAACYGLPTLTYDTGGVSTYVSHGVTGSCLPEDANAYDFAKEFSNLLKSNKLGQYSINARERFENRLNWDAWLNDFKQIELSLRTK